MLNHHYVVYTPARTGSTLYARVLDRYCSVYNNTVNNVCWDQDNLSDDYSSNHLIYHTHKINFLSKAPSNFIKIITTRSIIDSVISVFLAQQTGVWHAEQPADQTQYVKEYFKKKFYFDPSLFTKLVSEYDTRYTQVDQYIDTNPNNLIVLSYNDHALNLKNLCQTLHLDRRFISVLRRDYCIMSGGTRILNKYQLIENLYELVRIYVKLNVQHNYNDTHSLQKISKIIK